MRALLTCLLCLFSGVVLAVPVTWTIQDAYTNSGKAITGSFVFDADAPITDSVADVENGTVAWAADSYSDVDIVAFLQLTDANVDYLSCRYAFVDSVDDDGNESWYYEGCRTSNASQLLLFADFFLEGLAFDFSFADPLSNAGGTVAFTGTLSGEGSATFSGLVVASVVPIPGALWLFGSALAAIGWVRGRRTD